MHLFDEYIVWYEVGDGVSTKKRTKFEELLRQDVERFYNMLYERYGDNKYIRKRKQLSVFYKIKNLYIRTILRFFVNPHAILYLCSSMLQRKRGAHTRETEVKGFLEQPEFWKAI